VIETDRLLLRKPRLEDAPDLAVAYADPEVVRYIGDGSTATLERREDGRVVGRAGFLRWDPETWEVGGTETELGWLLAREHWGQGYATEAALALRDWAFEERGLTRLISLIQHENLRSIRVAERLGERYERDVEVRGKPSRLYSLER